MVGAQPMPEMPSESSAGSQSLRPPRMGIMRPMKASAGSTWPRLSTPMIAVSTRARRAARMPSGMPMTMAPMVAPRA